MPAFQRGPVAAVRHVEVHFREIEAGAGIDIGGVGTGALGGLCAFAICTIAPVPSAVTPASSLLRMPSIRPYRLALQMVARDAITAAQT